MAESRLSQDFQMVVEIVNETCSVSAEKLAGCDTRRCDMLLKVLRAKIHRATITEACVDYVGSITIDREFLDASGIRPGECVLVADLTDGQRFETYVFEGEPGSGVICINGAAARLVDVGDKVIIMAFGYVTPEEAEQLTPSVVLVDDENKISKVVK